MGIIEFIIVAALVGLIAWAATTYIPMPAAVKQIILVAVVIVLVVLLLRSIGLWPVHDVALPRVDQRGG